MDEVGIAFSVCMTCALIMGCAFGWSFTYAYYNSNILLSQESADAICYNLTSIEGVKGLSEHNKLVCEVPSFDSTSEIIIRTNGESK